MCLGGGGGDDYLREQYEQQKAEEAARQARITEGKDAISTAFAGYDDQFYADRAQDYVDYATPQIEDQYKNAMRDLTNALARSGNLQSSVGAERRADLMRRYDDAVVDAARRGQGYASDTRAALANVESNLQSQNASLADPTLIASMAASNSAAASALPDYSPLGQIFEGVTSGLATQAQLEARNKKPLRNG